MSLTEEAQNGLEKISCMSHGFTGADLQALLYTARLEAVKESLKAKVEEKTKTKPLKSKEIFEFDRETRKFLKVRVKVKEIEVRIKTSALLTFFFYLWKPFFHIFFNKVINEITEREGKTFFPPSLSLSLFQML